MNPFVIVAPSTRGLSLAIVRHFLRNTSLPVFATYRNSTAEEVAKNILGPISGRSDVDIRRLNLIPLDLTSEESIKSASETLSSMLPQDKKSYIHTAFFTGGILYPERGPQELDAQHISDTFRINVISHLLLIKYFSRFLPPPSTRKEDPALLLSKWVHVSARVGSISDNNLGGWYSYRASKAALNQVIRTFDLHLQAKKIPAMCVGVHPGTVKTSLSKPFWETVKEGKLFEPEYAAERITSVVEGLGENGRGKVWDWQGKEIPP